MNAVRFLRWHLLLLLICVVPLAATAASNAVPAQSWTKRGLIMKPGFAGPASSKLVSSPSVVKLPDGRLRMYFWAADGTPPWHGTHIILAAESEPGNPFAWRLLSNEPMVGPDSSGKIRDRGVGFPFVLAQDDGPWLMYYGAWGTWARNGELGNRTGLALSHDRGLTWKVVRETVLPLGKPGSYDAGLTGSVSVLRDDDGTYRMWYTAGEKYVRFGERNRGIVHVGAARSKDGIEWIKNDRAVLRARMETVDPYEAVLGKPNVIKLDGVYHMWVSVYNMWANSTPAAGATGVYDPRGDADRSDWASLTSKETGYHIEYARSTDGVNWQREFGKSVMELTPGEFDSKNQSYPAVVDMGSQLWMFYVGNEFGSTGIGLATLDKAMLSPAQ